MEGTKTTDLDDSGVRPTEVRKGLTVGHVIQIKVQARHIKKNLEYQKAARRVILPNSKFKYAWDSCNFLFLIYSVFEIPYSLGFISALCDDTWHGKLNLSVDCIFLCDCIINFVTAYFDEETGIYEVHLTSIARHYMRGWFLFDLGSSLPFDQIVCANLQHGDEHSMAIRLLRIFRVVKVLRIVRMLRLAARLEEAIGSFASKSLRLMKFVGILLLCGHICACVWHSSIDANNCMIPSGPIPTGSVTCGCDGDKCQDYNWLVKYDDSIYTGNNTYSRYLVSVYYAVVTLTTLGYGDVVPTNDFERGISSGLALLGALMFSFLISNISVLVSKGNAVEVAVSEELHALRDLCSAKNVPVPLALSIRKSAGYMLEHVPHSLLRGVELLPRALHSEVTELVASDSLGGLFQALSVDSRARLAAVLRPCALPPGRFVFRALDIATEIYWVVKGEVEMIDVRGIIVGRCGPPPPEPFSGEGACRRIASTEASAGRSASAWGHLPSACFGDVPSARGVERNAGTECWSTGREVEIRRASTAKGTRAHSERARPLQASAVGHCGLCR